MKLHPIALGAMLLAGTAIPAAAADYTMILAHTLNDTTHPLYQAFVMIEKEIEEKSEGRIDVQHQPGGALGGDRELMESMLLGDVQFVPTSTSGAVQFVPEFAAFEIPYAFPTDTARLRRILNDSEFTAALEEKLAAQGMKFGKFYNGGFRQLTTSGTQVHTPADIKGNNLRIRVPENPYSVATWSAIGAAPTPIAFPELYGALQQKVVDGQENPYGHILSQRFYEVQDYLTTTSHILLANVNLINKDWYDSLPEDLKQVVDQALADAEEFQWTLQDEMLGEQRAAIAEHMEIIDLTEDELQQFREATAPIQDMVRGEIGDEMVDTLMSSIASVN
ncbi:TRAP transporter substrate-binding protein [Tropicimonas sp.]|uniref:TRAP transporter substrate-binding protein n=1 Tax=Tropicimonas sp. TaxID=2067044 RepID=UPI003A8A9B6A